MDTISEDELGEVDTISGVVLSWAPFHGRSWQRWPPFQEMSWERWARKLPFQERSCENGEG